MAPGPRRTASPARAGAACQERSPQTCRGHGRRTMTGVVEVRILGVPRELYPQAVEDTDEMKGEFASAVTPEGHEAGASARPVRLIGVVPVGRLVAGPVRAWP